MDIVDITNLPPPDAIEPLDFETILAERVEELLALVPDDRRQEVEETIALESEPLTIALQNAAYREMLLIAKMNQKIRAIFLATATGTDLEHHGVPWSIKRKVIQEENLEANPPLKRIMESDGDLRRRIQMAPYKLSTAGPSGAYEAHSLDFDKSIKDASTTRPIPGTVRVHILSRNNQGQPTDDLLAGLYDYLSDEQRRPLNDTVQTVAATAKKFELIYEVTYVAKPEIDITKAEVARRIQQLLEQRQMLGRSISLVHIYGAIDVPGVEKARIISPKADVDCTEHEYPMATKVEER